MIDEHEFRVRPGRIGDRRGSRGFVADVLQAAARAGYLRRGGGGPVGRSGRGRAVAIAAALRSPARRVVVKARVVRHAGQRFRSAPLATHLAYLQREGVDRVGGPAVLFDEHGEADGRAFAARCEEDRHHFRFIVSPEDAAELGDLRAFGRDLMRRLEKDLGTGLDWVAVDHWDTGRPHLHLLVRGRDDAGADLVIAGEYIARGVRARAEALVSLELGPRTAREVAAGLERETVAERWTPIDRLMEAHAPDGRLDLRPGRGAPDIDMRVLLTGRVRALERLGLAVGEGPAVWRLATGREARLRELGRRGDIIATLHRAAGTERALADLRPYGEAAEAPIVGRVLARGLHDELTGAGYLVVDAVDGRVHHVVLRDLQATGDTPRGGLVEVAAGEGPFKLRHRSDLAIEGQVRAEGATWLDRQLVAREPLVLAGAGFGAEVTRALERRAAHLEADGLARRMAGGEWAFAPGMLATLRARDLKAAGVRLARETGLKFEPETREGAVGGVFRRRLDLGSGRFAMIERDGAFRLLPWSRRLDRELGKAVEGTLEGGMMRLAAGRNRGLER